MDIATILTLTALNLFVVSAALPFVMGLAVSHPARLIQISLLAQAMAWASMVSAEHLWDMPLSVLAMVLGSVANYCLFFALQGWLGTRPWLRLLQAACILLPLGYGLSFHHYPTRVGWANAWLTLQFLLVARAALWPIAEWGKRWRYLLAGCYCAVAALTFARGVLGAFFTELYPTFTTPHPINLLAQVMVNIAMPLTTIAFLVAWRKESENLLKQQALTDPLTRLPNRRGLLKAAPQLLAQAQRQRWSLAVVMLDLDHFKRVNDVHGHEAGDRSLALFADVIRACLRNNDLAARIGGEEFVLLLPHTDSAGAALLDARLRGLLQTQSVNSLGWALSYSAGLAMCPSTGHDPLGEALAKADHAMYQAKSEGRARMCEASDTTQVTTPNIY